MTHNIEKCVHCVTFNYQNTRGHSPLQSGSQLLVCAGWPGHLAWPLPPCSWLLHTRLLRLSPAWPQLPWQEDQADQALQPPDTATGDT